MRINITKCYRCLCSVCTRRKCPYSDKCKACTNNNMRYTYDCDYFENKHTAPKRYKIKKCQKQHKDIINTKLDLIMQRLDLEVPITDINNTYRVLYKGISIGTFDNYRTAVELKEKYQSEFSTKLKIERLEIEL